MGRAKKYTLNSPLSLLSTILLGIFIIPVVVFPFINALGGIGEIITDLVELLPFGEGFYAIAVLIVNSMAGQAVNFHDIQGVFTLSYLVQELAEGIFTIIIYEALCLGSFMLMGLDSNTGGRWNGMKRTVVNVVMAVIAACLAPALINWTFSNMQGFTISGKIIWSAVVSIILMGGGVAFFVFLSGFTIAKSLVFVALKFLLIGALRLSGSYICLLVLLFGFEQGLWELIIGGLSGFLGIALILCAIELMLDSIF